VVANTIDLRNSPIDRAIRCGAADLHAHFEPLYNVACVLRAFARIRRDIRRPR